MVDFDYLNVGDRIRVSFDFTDDSKYTNSMMLDYAGREGEIVSIRVNISGVPRATILFDGAEYSDEWAWYPWHLDYVTEQEFDTSSMDSFFDGGVDFWLR